jgi:hypothetical protein
MTVRSAALAVLIAGAISALPAGAASAASTPIVGGGSFARTVPFIDGYIYAFECHVAAPGAVSTSVNSCVLTNGTSSIAAPPSTSSGSFAQTNEAVSIDTATFKVCWTGSASYSDGSSQSTSGCTTSSPFAGAG